MCASYQNTLSRTQLLERFGCVPPPEYHESLDLRPDNAVLVITGTGAAMKRWGLKAAWDNKLIINARSETISEKPSFQKLLGNRCLIPATGWYEWQEIPGAKRKRKHGLRADGQQSFCFAGLTDGDRVVMLTRAPASTIAHVHDRMPAVLSAEEERRWIDPAARFADVRSALTRRGDFSAKPLEDMPAIRPIQQDLFT